MRTETVHVPHRLPGWNEYVAKDRRNRYAGGRMKKDTTSLVAFYAKKARIAPFVRPVVINLTWIEPNRRRDVDNIQGASKFVLDGLREAGVLANDTQKHVRHVTHDPIQVSKTRPGVVVTITEVEA